jgi:hypothetical protein
MKIIRVNILSSLYATLAALYLELSLNILRLQQWISNVNLTTITIIAAIILVILWYPFVKLTNHYISGCIKYWSVILWVPYTVLFVKILTLLTPIKDPQYIPSPGLFFYLIPKLIVLCVYIFSINFFSPFFTKQQ